jgi:methenyltetrahydromethanopterin cyclohydrolase
MDLGLNRRASALADAMVAEEKALRLRVTTLDNGARVIDCGIDAEGGFEAGRRLGEICLGGRGTVSLTTVEVGSLTLPAIQVITDDPVEACLASQYAGWAIQREKYFAMGSGPARCLSRAEKELYERLGYVERSDRAVLVLEGRTPPDASVAAYVAERCGVEPAGLTLLIAPTASVAGCAQIAARSVETALHKLMELGFELAKIRSGAGVCPIAPVAKNDLRGIGWTNDCILYGTRTYLTVRASDEEIAAVADRLPASAAADYGTPFYDIFKRYDGQFYKIDKMLFSPAEVTINSLLTGQVVRRGRLNPDVLQASFGIA